MNRIGMILIIIVTLCASMAMAHEPSGWNHMRSSSGPLIGERYCGIGHASWYHDDNDDGKVDRCTIVMVMHNTFHIRPGRMQAERGIDGSLRIGCSCEPIGDTD